MQRGGNLGVLTPVFLLFAALFANNPTFMKVLTVAQTLIGGDSQGGGNKRLNQMGGGEKIDKALAGLRGTIEADTTLTDDRKTELIGCIDTLTSNGGISDADIQRISDTPQTGGRDWGLSMPSSLSLPSSLSALKDKAAATAAAAQENAAALRGRFADSDFGKSAASTAAAAKDTVTTSFQAAQTAMGELKDDRMAKFMDNIKNQIETVKSKIVNKVLIMKDTNKQQCMKSILSYGFDLIKNKISSGISVENIKKAMAVEVELAKETGAKLLSRGSELGSALLSRGSELFSRGLGSVKPSSTPLPDDTRVIHDNTPDYSLVQRDALIAANIEANKSYDAAVEVRNAAKSKVTYNKQNGIQNQATEDALDQAQTATSTAYQVALNAAKAAESAGVPNVTFPKVRP